MGRPARGEGQGVQLRHVAEQRQGADPDLRDAVAPQVGASELPPHGASSSHLRRSGEVKGTPCNIGLMWHTPHGPGETGGTLPQDEGVQGRCMAERGRGPATAGGGGQTPCSRP